MTGRLPDGPLTSCCIFLAAFGLSLLANRWLTHWLPTDTNPSWVASGLRNLAGYSTVLLPGYLVYRHAKSTGYLSRSTGDSTRLGRFLVDLFVDDDDLLLPDVVETKQRQRSGGPLADFCLLSFYFVGLQVSFLTWGVLQEKVMTRPFTNAAGEVGRFVDSQFLVFVNRILAFAASGFVLSVVSRQRRRRAPLYKYAFCSASNVVSSWCQYEALKYVSFPHQVLAKSGKVVPVMIMGRLVSRTEYPTYEYVTTGILTVGMTFFLLGAETSDAPSPATTLSGVFLLAAYITFDSFTSNWQGALFNRYSVTPVQMMCAVNCFSCLLTAVSLIQTDAFADSLTFVWRFPGFAVDCLLLSVCSAAGQMFIFRTIATFGPTAFAVMTTVRQGLSVLLSCVVYGHEIEPVAAAGVSMVFLSIFLRLYCAYRAKSAVPTAKS